MRRISLSVLVVLLLTFVQAVSAGITPAEAEYFFTEIKGSTGPRRIVPITVTNPGPGSITINSATFTGPQASEYSFSTAPTFPLVLAANASVTYNVVFYPPGTTTYTPPYPPSSFRTATLQINSTDATTPVLNVGLYGISLDGTTGNYEARLQMVTDILGYSTNIGTTAYLARPLPEDFTPIGDEIVAQRFVKAGAGPVTMTTVVRFSPAGVINYGYYFPNGTSNPPQNLVNQIADTNAIGNGLNHQTLMPATTGSNRTFDPGTAEFGLYVLSPAFPSYTEDGLNGREGQRIRAARTFIVRQRNGAPRPNTYLVVFEDSTNGDFQDFGFLMTNVQPVTPPPTPTSTPTNTPTATSTATLAPGECIYQEAAGTVVIEAEGYGTNTPALGDSWQVVTDAAYVGTALQSLPNDGTNTNNSTNGPRLTYRIAFTTPGIYYVALRSLGPTGADDTVFIGVDGAQISQLGLGNSLRWYDKFGSTDVAVTIPSAGTYTFTIWMREDGSIVDRIWLSTNASAVTNSNNTLNPPVSACDNGGPTATPTSTYTPSNTPTNTPTSTPSNTPTNTPTSTPTNTPSNTPTSTPTSTTIPTGGCVYQEASGTVVMEAENYDTNTAALGDSWQLVTNVTNYSGSGAMQSLLNDGTNTNNSTNGPRLTYRIAFTTTGTYYVSLRSYGPSTLDDTVFIGVDGAQTSQLGLGGAPLRWYDKFGTTDVAVNIPSAGTYTFMLWMREDGSIVDRIWLSTNANAVTNSNSTLNPANSAVDCSGSGFAARGSSSSSVIVIPPAASAMPSATNTSVPATSTLTPTATQTLVPTATNTDVPTATSTEIPTDVPTATELPTQIPPEAPTVETPAS